MSYTWDGMKKITFEEAQERFNNNQEVYLLYWEDNESACESLEDLIEHHEKGYGEFGYEIK